MSLRAGFGQKYVRSAPRHDLHVSSATIQIRVQPRAKRDEVAAVRGGVVVIRVAAPALDGRANKAVCAFLAKRLGVRASSVSILRGERARDKLVRIEGMAQEEAEAALTP